MFASVEGAEDCLSERWDGTEMPTVNQLVRHGRKRLVKKAKAPAQKPKKKAAAKKTPARKSTAGKTAAPRRGRPRAAE